MPSIFASTEDGTINKSGLTNWSNTRDASTGTSVSTTATGNGFGVNVVGSAGRGGGQGPYTLQRSFFSFDTSGISVTPANATLRLFGFINNSADIIAVKATFSTAFSPHLTTGGFDSLDFSTPFSSQISTWSTSGYNDITLNSDALAMMRDEDDLKIAVIEHDFDFSNVDPGTSTVIRTGFFFANNSGTSKDPVVEYTEGSTGYGNAVMGVASGNIAKVNGVATANIDKVIGV